VYLKRPLNLHGSAEEIFLRADLVIEDMIMDIVATRPVPVAQSGEVVSFARRKPSDGDWSHFSDLEEVYDRIRMLDASGYPPAFVDVGEFRLEFTRASRRVDGVVADVRIRRRSDIE
jgi:methionyl-tRNA formyltransferase